LALVFTNLEVPYRWKVHEGTCHGYACTSTGFGRILTEKLLQQGQRVAATLRKPDVLDDLKKQYGDQLWIARLDVTNNAQVKAVVKMHLMIWAALMYWSTMQVMLSFVPPKKQVISRSANRSIRIFLARSR
jgi:saccharopine dehydrogenase-like NADP-dependent oxidoreductase